MKLTALMAAATACMIAGAPSPAASQATIPTGPPSTPMTIPLPDPLFWDPVTASGDYAVVEQQEGLFLIRPATGRIIARLHPPDEREAMPLGTNPGARSKEQPQSGGGFTMPDGWPFRPGDEVPSTPVIGDLDGDGTMEIAFVTGSGWVWVVSANGLPPAGWPVYLGVSCMAGIALADLNGDGHPEIIAGDGAGRVHAFLRDGSYLPGWPAQVPGSREIPGIYGAVAAADMDGDGRIEVVVTQGVGRICAFRSDGTVVTGWPVSTVAAEDPPNAGTIFSRPAIGDIDGDGKSEIVAGANSYRIYAFTADGRACRGWPRTLDNRGRAGYSDPVLADLDGDGHPEILIATDRGFSGPARIYALNAQGMNAPGWPVNLPEGCNAAIAVGHLDREDKIEVIAATIGDECKVLALNESGKMRRGFPVTLPQMSVNSSPILADVDGDGRPEIVIASLRTRFEPASVVLAIDGRGEIVKPFPISLDGCEVVSGGPCVADLGGDGRAELILGTEVEGRIYVWNLVGSYETRCAPWPRPGGDCANTGLYRPEGSREPVRGGAATAWRFDPVDRPAPGSDPADGSARSLQSISFALGDEGSVQLCIRNMQRQTIRTLLDGVLPRGSYTIIWDGNDSGGKPAKAGIYIYDLELPGRRRTGQILLVR